MCIKTHHTRRSGILPDPNPQRSNRCLFALEKRYVYSITICPVTALQGSVMYSVYQFTERMNQCTNEPILPILQVNIRSSSPPHPTPTTNYCQFIPIIARQFNVSSLRTFLNVVGVARAHKWDNSAGECHQPRQ